MADMTITLTSPSFQTEVGQDVDMFTAPSELTVAQAAVLLDMPVGCLNELLDNGAFEFRRENGERLLLREPLLEYKEWSERTDAWLAEEVRWNQEMGFYD
jgi:cytochrome P450